MICKLIIHGETRQETIQRLDRALSELIIDGISTTSEIFNLIIKNKNFIDGSYGILARKPFRRTSENYPKKINLNVVQVLEAYSNGFSQWEGQI